MTVKELKTKIQELIETFPEENLEEIYAYIQGLKNLHPETIRNSRNLSKILSEDKELLKKLAQ
jgi:hypothetical protein